MQAELYHQSVRDFTTTQSRTSQSRGCQKSLCCCTHLRPLQQDMSELKRQANMPRNASAPIVQSTSVPVLLHQRLQHLCACGRNRFRRKFTTKIALKTRPVAAGQLPSHQHLYCRSIKAFNELFAMRQSGSRGCAALTDNHKSASWDKACLHVICRRCGQ